MDRESSRSLPGAVLVGAVALASALWPEPVSAGSLVMMSLFCVGCAALMPAPVVAYTAASFLVSASAAFLVYQATDPVNQFVTSYQELGASDSQFFLYCAQEFRRAPSFEALLTTWGSLAPVLYGGVALQVFGDAFLGITLANAALYGISIHILLRLLMPDERGVTTAGLLACVLPLQSFYNSMLAKEPIYLFLCSVSLLLISRMASEPRRMAGLMTALALVLLALVFFRPVATLILLSVTLWFLRAPGQRKAFAAFFGVATAGAVAAAAVAVWSGVRIPLFFLTSAGSVGFDQQAELVGEFASDKAAVGGFLSFFEPPVSLLLSPVLGLLWLVAPFPMMGQFLASVPKVLGWDFTFLDLAAVARGVDSLVMLTLLGVVARVVWARRRERGGGLLARIVGEPTLMFTVLSVLGIAAFQFVESGRHRYSVTPVLLIFAWSLARCWSPRSRMAPSGLASNPARTPP